MSIIQGTGRTERLTRLLPEAGIDALLVTDLVNVRYLTGYTGSNGLALIGSETRVFITDFRYVQQAAEEVEPSFDRRQAPLELVQSVEEVLPSGPLRLGFEAAHVSVRDYDRLRETLPERVDLVGVEGLVEQLRAIKEPDEVARIRAASRVADAAFSELIGEGLVGHTEREVAFALTQKLHAHGADRPSFDIIVAAGTHGALPHATPRQVEIKPGELVVIDWGVELDGYCSDCTRTVATGEPGDQAREIYGLVLEAQLAGLAAVRAGASARGADSAAREVIAAAGHGEQFGHGLGHGVGLAIHEDPRLSQRSDAELQAGNVVTVEPGVYLPDQFGVRIEDLVVVTDAGCEILTGVVKDLTIIG
jgi:Xaa-Pro aminopeptidase